MPIVSANMAGVLTTSMADIIAMSGASAVGGVLTFSNTHTAEVIVDVEWDTDGTDRAADSFPLDAKLAWRTVGGKAYMEVPALADGKEIRAKASVTGVVQWQFAYGSQT